ncbi:DUF5131 family protein (plasmid) [Bradyrhizobium oligotrophicum S58]
MADRSKIEWTDSTWNPIRARLKRDMGARKAGMVGWHCERVTTGCGTPKEGGCYAEALNHRLGTGLPFKPGYLDDGTVELFLDDNILRQPLRWKRPRMVFPCSMTDLFGRFVKDEWLDKIFAVMALTRQHTYQPLTKRSDRMRVFLSREWAYESIYNAMGELGRSGATEPHPYRTAFPNGMPWPLPNVWLGVSTERQQEADARIPDLLATPAAVRFISAEPLLGPIDLAAIDTGLHDGTRVVLDALAGLAHCAGEAVSGVFGQPDPQLDWVIAGGESGPHARPMHPDWARSLRDQCRAAGVPFFFKQWGEWACGCSSQHGNSWIDPAGNVHCRPVPLGEPITRVGKKGAGRLLDGVAHNGMPEVRPS